WLSHPGARTFDLFLIHYGEANDFGREDATYYEHRKGFKWELLDYVTREHAHVLERYTNIWIPDHDIRADTPAINRLFELFEQYTLQLAQPAIAQGEVSYQALRQRRGVVLRYTPFVEIMCPLFTRQALDRVSSTFTESRSGWGLDWVWPRYFRPREIAIIDAVGVEHTGPLFNGENYRRLAALGIDPAAEFQRLTARYGGFKRGLHRRLVRGKIRLPEVREQPQAAGLLARLFAKTSGLRWRQAG
ncbi:MAG TPA: hypothetical protein VHV08_00040, partial [Pirellulales bacterium]|nr:hypothetical protein [Pirellulales bacterium]